MTWKSWGRKILERCYRRKLIAGLRVLQSASLEDLRSREFLVSVIGHIGLRYDRRRIYGWNNTRMNPFGPGLWQIPEQLAEALIFLSHSPMRSVLEVGTCDGWTSSVMAAYLRRFHRDLHFVTTDITGQFAAYADVCRIVPVEYYSFRSAEAFAGEDFDLVFIDGDHNYRAVARDYQLLGKNAAICMFHDIDDLHVGQDNVPRFWKELKSCEAGEAEFREFLGPRGVMGIGIRRKREAGEI